MAKRPNGEGSYQQRADGRWMCSIMDGYQPNGKRKVVTIYGKTQAECRKKVKQFRDDRDAGLRTENIPTFSAWADTWFEGHKKAISETTQEGYKYTLKALKAYFQNRPINEIRAIDVENCLNFFRDAGRSASYLAKCRSELYLIFFKAEANDYIRKNPVRFAETVRAEKTSVEKEIFTEEEVRTLYAKLPDELIGNGIRILLGTGMRTQELLALQPEHIAEDGSTIRIVQALKCVRGTVKIGPPKSQTSVRLIPVPKALQPCALKLRDTDQEYIFEAGKKGQPGNPTWFRKQFREAIDSVGGVRKLTPHCCRHTYVSQMQAVGVDIATIQSIVGHADIDMTQHYLHVMPQVKTDAVSKLDSKLFDGISENS